jgi:drug/metabolite transporter (DMT)-like permease
MAFLYAAIGSLLITLGQVLWKIAIDKNGGLINCNYTIAQNILNIFGSPYMLLGLLIYALATLFWMYLLGKYEYSYIYPMFSLTYVFSFVFAIFLFDENINLQKWLGVIVIIIGIFIISKSH